jgi:hypothetical protein
MASAKRKRITAVLDTQAQDLDTDLTYGQRQDLKIIVDNTLTKTSTQGKKKMTPTTAVTTKKIQRTVFDLQVFDDVKLVKDVPLPKKPEEIQEALDILGSKEKLLEVIYKGLIAEATDSAWEDIDGFRIVGSIGPDKDGNVVYTPDADGEPTEPYTGKFADEAKGKLINAAILSLAKMQGYEKSLSKEKKAALKEKATEFLRANPAMLQSIQG